MKSKNVIIDFKIEKTTDPNNRNKLIEAKFFLIPHPFYISEIRKANARAGQIEKQLKNDQPALPGSQ